MALMLTAVPAVAWAVDTDGDTLDDTVDLDDDNDGVADLAPDSAPLDPQLCQDLDGDGCDDCSQNPTSSATPNAPQWPLYAPSTASDGPDNDLDGLCDSFDPDDDNDGVSDAVEIGNGTNPLDPLECGDSDSDGCDDCSVGVDGFGPLSDSNPANDGIDTDGDGLCDSGVPAASNDDDDDNDGEPDGSDPAPLDPQICGNADGDTCDDCALNPTSTVTPNVPQWPGYVPAPDNDGLDTDGDVLCDASDPDDDNDGQPDGSDPAATDPRICGNADGDTCDDCSLNPTTLATPNVPPWPLYAPSPANDGLDTDGDLLCNADDPDDDNDGVLDGPDSADLDPRVCTDADGDNCNDCSQNPTSSGDPTPWAAYSPSTSNDGLDTDGDGDCNLGDNDDDNDGRTDGGDAQPLNPRFCSRDTDGDGCDDCGGNPKGVGDPTPWPPYTYDPDNDGLDTDGDGDCNLGDTDDDNDGVNDAVPDSNPVDPRQCRDSDGDGCDDCSQNPTSTATPNVPAWPTYSPTTSTDGLDTDGDGSCNVGDSDDDNDGRLDVNEPSPAAELDPQLCGNSDADSCDDCSQNTTSTATPNVPAWPVYSPAPANDGLDTDGDVVCDASDSDDDNDGVPDAADVNFPLNPRICEIDADLDGCDDCAGNPKGVGDPIPWPQWAPNVAADGPDANGDGYCDAGDPDGDTVPTLTDNCPLTPNPGQENADGDANGNACDNDDDNDGKLDVNEPPGGQLDPRVCGNSDLDTCDDCALNPTSSATPNSPPWPPYTPNAANDGLDTDGDLNCNASDFDDDNDGRLDGADPQPLDPKLCGSVDGDSCDDCSLNPTSSGDPVPWPQYAPDPADDGLDTDGDFLCDASDSDDDNDGVADGSDSAPLDPRLCQDLDGDACNDCSQNPTSSGTPRIPPWPQYFPNTAADGTDTDGDIQCNSFDLDDDNDGVNDGLDSAPLDPQQCQDLDGDNCNDCSQNPKGVGDPTPWLLYIPSMSDDGLDTDGDVTCDFSDLDDDNDGVDDGPDSAPVDPQACQDLDTDTCDDCALNPVALGDPTPWPTYTPSITNDGLDTDGDVLTQCDASDLDDDNDGVADGSDSAPVDPQECQDVDADGCNDCSQNPFALGDPTPWTVYAPSTTNDGLDTDGDVACNLSDTDDDNDGVSDAQEAINATDPLDPRACSDTEPLANGSSGDGCDDCSLNPKGINDPTPWPLYTPDVANDYVDGDDPVNGDNDDDTICNLTDNCLDTINPTQLNEDADSLGNACDNCDLDANELQEDNDADGNPAVCDTQVALPVCGGDVCDDDDDNDTLRDGQELAIGTLPNNPDSDGDTIRDDVEVGPDPSQPLNTDFPADNSIDALDVDSDNDNILDSDEAGANPGGVNPVDSDGDGDPDYIDLDSDQDGVSDSKESGPPNKPLSDPPVDTDGNGDPDYIDYDSDEDGICDGGISDGPLGDAGCAVNDNCTSQASCSAVVDCDIAPTPPDPPRQGFDNCRIVDNFDQADTDCEGVGDACANDADGDGVDDSVDNCLYQPNAGQEDNDQFIDPPDNTTAETNPNDANDPCNGTVADSPCGGDACDVDDDNDGVLDDDDVDPFDPQRCQDTEDNNGEVGDGCDDCTNYSGNKDGFGPLADNDPADDGPDLEPDGICDDIDLDDDGVIDSEDNCISVANGDNPGEDNQADNDGDGPPQPCDSGAADPICGGDACDVDDDNDGVNDDVDSDPLDPRVCENTDGDSCDDCALNPSDSSSPTPWPTYSPNPDDDGCAEGGAGGAGGAGGSGGETVAPSEPPKFEGGCKCRAVGGRDDEGTPWALSLLVALGIALGGRRRGKGRRAA